MLPLGPLLALVAATAAPELTVYFHADLNGRLAPARCGALVPASAPDYADLVGTLRQARDDGPATTLALLGPNSIAPDPFVQQPFASDPQSAATSLARLFARAGYAAFALGSHDLGLDPAWAAAYARAMGAAGVPLVLSNLTCGADAPAGRAALCQAARRRVLVDVGGQKVGVLAVISPRLAPGIEPSRRAGLTFEEPLEAMKRESAALRRDGATRILVMAEVPSGGLEELRALQLLAGRMDPRPDAILAAGLADPDGERAVRALLQDDAPIAVGSTAGARGLTLLAFGDAEPRTAVLAATPGRADPEAAAILAPWVASSCASGARPVADVHGQVTRAAFVTYVLEVMRRAADAEVAVVNDKLVKGTPFPLTGAFTEGQLAQAIPYRAVVVTARVAGGLLGTTVGAALDNPKVRAVGIAKDGGLKVNGRPIDNTRHYRVATIAFVAEGGDGIFVPKSVPWQPLPGTPDVADLVRRFVEREARSRDGVPTLAPASDFGPPASQRLLVVGLTDLELALSDTTIGNAAGYTDSQLARAQQTSLKSDWASVLTTRAPTADTDTRFRLQYGWTRTIPTSGPTVSAESLDLLTGSFIYSDRRLRNVWTKAPAASVPDPYARVGLESEVTRPLVTPTQTRTYHHAELTATAGASVKPIPKLRLRAGGGARKELVAPGAAGRWRSVIEVGGTLDQMALATVADLPVRFDATVDYVLIEPTSATAQQVRGSAHLSVPLLPLLFVSAGVDVYGASYSPGGWAWSADTTVGLRLHLDAAHQRL
jgi:2',3'-cyclic-nucleotide 2'-phosphodiesterase (5'-nucleotidase family)